MARVLQVVTELVVGGASLSMLDLAEDLASEHELLIAHGVPGRSGQRRGARARMRVLPPTSCRGSHGHSTSATTCWPRVRSRRSAAAYAPT